MRFYTRFLSIALLLLNSQHSSATIDLCPQDGIAELSCESGLGSLVVIIMPIVASKEASEASSQSRDTEKTHHTPKLERGQYVMIRREHQDTHQKLTLKHQDTSNEVDILVPTQRYDKQAKTWQTKQINAEQTHYGWHFSYLEAHIKQTIGVLVNNPALIATESTKVI